MVALLVIGIFVIVAGAFLVGLAGGYSMGRDAGRLDARINASEAILSQREQERRERTYQRFTDSFPMAR